MRRRDGLSTNITSCRLQHVEKRASGLVAHDIELPLGYHCLTLSVANMIGKAALCTSISPLPMGPSLHLDGEYAQDLRF